MNTVLSLATMTALHALRAEMVAAGETNSVGGPSCGVTAEEAAVMLGGTEHYGAFRVSPVSAPEHAWVVLPDGTIVDASADQFGLPPIVVAAPGSALAARYLDQAGDDGTADSPIRR